MQLPVGTPYAQSSPSVRASPTQLGQRDSMIPPRVNVDIVRKRIGAYADTRQTAEQRYEIYKGLIGFLPPRIDLATRHRIDDVDRTAARHPSCPSAACRTT